MNYYKDKYRKFKREQLVFTVGVMITAVVDIVVDTFPARDLTDKVEDLRRWEKEREDIPDDLRRNPHAYLGTLLTQLGYNLSNFYAYLTGDGLGATEALDGFNPNLREALTEWFTDWVEGTKGAIPYRHPDIDLQQYIYDTPKAKDLAEKWVDNVFRDYL
jgi:hypothetical protein